MDKNPFVHFASNHTATTTATAIWGPNVALCQADSTEKDLIPWGEGRKPLDFRGIKSWAQTEGEMYALASQLVNTRDGLYLKRCAKCFLLELEQLSSCLKKSESYLLPYRINF